MERSEKAIILAVDDDPGVVNTVMSVLREQYAVKPFTSGGQALKYLRNASADLILLDYHMPEMSGPDVLDALRNDPETAKIPVIVLTGSGLDATEVEVLEKGALDYIHKPIRAAALLARVRLQLELKNYRHHLEDMVESKTRDLSFAYNKLKQREEVTLGLLARVTDMRDHDTGDHIVRSTNVTRIVVEELQHLRHPDNYRLCPSMADDIINSVKLHDIGKIAIPDHILQKPGELTQQEFERVKLHPQRGAQLLEEFIVRMGKDSFLNTAHDIVLYHHERWDGTGYPTGLKGENIPLSARITALADVYDALTSARPYKDAFSHEHSLIIIQDSAGTHFDPYLVRVFMLLGERIKKALHAVSGGDRVAETA